MDNVAQSADHGRGVIAADDTPKARLERAAVRLFGAQGVDGTSMRQIAAGADMSLGAVYAHYDSKDKLAFALMSHTHKRLAGLIAAAAAGGDLSVVTGRIIDGYCAAADDDWDLFRFYLINLHRFENLAGGKRGSPTEAAAKIVRRAITSGDIVKKPALLTAAMALGVVMQAGLARSYGQINGPLSKHKDQFKAAVTAVLEAGI
ncbi:TetR/AcrR family transcriptional regulator [Robiginitomaculum antarcticum]|uniref:TetR/AcrR family transcriptional regulator n=1 Tax=Robiginitomaculum antarcticum TaxID=437507 RepID=UPI00037E25AF|nr:TetR/AcrR family transcriptional regulator [Robiginitomaculum antarcticum]